MCPLQDPVNYTMEIVDDRGEVVTSTSVLAAQGNSDGLVMTVFESGLVTSKTLAVRLILYNSLLTWRQAFTTEGISRLIQDRLMCLSDVCYVFRYH